MGQKLEQIYFRDDLTDFISQRAAEYYGIPILSTKWIKPFGYYDEINQSIRHNGALPRGLYILAGMVEYPDADRLGLHRIGQFNLLHVAENILMAAPLNKYPGRPQIPLSPLYPLVYIGESSQAGAAKAAFDEVSASYWPPKMFKAQFRDLPQESVEYKIKALRYALQINLLGSGGQGRWD